MLQPRIFARFITAIIFVFTCFLTVDVVAKERELAPILTPDAWRLLSDADAYIRGFQPAKVTTLQLKPRRGATKRMPVRLPNSRVMVKFSDELQIRLDEDNAPYSQTNPLSTVVADIVNSLGVTLLPVINTPTENIDAVVRRAELRSQKQQPDLAGIYFVDGGRTSVDVAAEIFYVMDEVEWVIYKPVISLSQEQSRYSRSNQNRTLRTTTESRRNYLRSQQSSYNYAQEYGACIFSQYDCEPRMTREECYAQGGTFLGVRSICGSTSERTMFGEPNGACCVPDGGGGFNCLDVPEESCTLFGGNFLGNFSNCTDSTCDSNSPKGACCVPDTETGVCSIETEDDCGALAGVWSGPNSLCATFPCADPTGSCCLLLGGCDDDVIQTDCEDAGNTFLGMGTTCTVTSCPDVAQDGACCLGAVCSIETSPDCDTLGGIYQGFGSTCASFPCTSTGSCCVDGTCTDDSTESDCLDGGGTYQGNGTVCVDNEPCDVDGACCIDGFCINPAINETECNAAGGLFLGSESTCTATTCVVLIGACCVDEDCSIETEADCVDVLEGDYQGDGTDCSTNPCGDPLGGCCVRGGFGNSGGICSIEIEDDCDDALGTFLGDGTECNDDGTSCDFGQCCIPGICVAVPNESGCLMSFNGVYLGTNVNSPPNPCVDQNIDGDCEYPNFNTNGTFTNLLTNLTGDCYIDQTSQIQNARQPLDPLYGTDVPSGCLDTEIPTSYPNGTAIPTGTNGGMPPGFTDFMVITDIDNPVRTLTNVDLLQNCGTTISTNVPYCAGTDWDALCASYANAYAVNINGDYVDICTRERYPGPDPTAANPLRPSFCFQPWGPTHDPRRVQPRINNANVGSGIMVFFDTSLNQGADALVLVTGDDLDPATDDNMLQLYTGTPFVFQAETTTVGVNMDDLAFWIEDTGALSWTATVLGQGETVGLANFGGPDLLDNTTGLPPADGIPDPVSVFGSAANAASLFANDIVGDNTTDPNLICIATVAGRPTVTRVVPDADNGIPNYAAMGLSGHMTELQIPWNRPIIPLSQPLPLPIAYDELTATEIIQLHQLLPWPMGGAHVQVGFNYTPPMDGSIDPVGGGGGWWAGEGHNLFPSANNPDGIGGDQNQYLGAYGYGQKWANDPNDPSVNGAFGNNVRIAVLDWSAHLQEQTDTAGVNLGGIHAELTNVILEGEATGHPHLELLFDESTNPSEHIRYQRSADHGSAVLSVIGAPWGPASAPGVAIETRLAGNFGMLGIVPDAELFFFPITSISDPDREPTAWLHCFETLDAGDIICASYEPVYPISATQPNLNYWEDSNVFLEVANGLGITVVIRAGEHGANLSELGGELDAAGGDQEAIVATTVTPGLPWKRWCEGQSLTAVPRGASNYSTAGSMAEVTASAWGCGITACGKGPLRDNYLGFNTLRYSDPTDPHVVNAFAYTNNFGGMGAAAAVVAGTTGILQGFSIQEFGMGLPPVFSRLLMSGGVYEGLDKDGLYIIRETLTSCEVDRSSEIDGNPLDWDFVEDVGNGWLTGTFADPRWGMIGTKYDPIWATPNIDNIMVVRGDYMFGNRFSIANRDGLLFGINAVQTTAHIAYPVPTGVPGPYVFYRGHGKLTDLYVSGKLQSGLPATNQLSIEVTFGETGTQPGRLFFQTEMWNFQTGRWQEAAPITFILQGTVDVDLVVPGASMFIHPSTLQYHLRLVTLDIDSNGNGGPNTALPIYYDQILVKALLLQIPQP